MMNDLLSDGKYHAYLYEQFITHLVTDVLASQRIKQLPARQRRARDSTP